MIVEDILFLLFLPHHQVAHRRPLQSSPSPIVGHRPGKKREGNGRRFSMTPDPRAFANGHSGRPALLPPARATPEKKRNLRAVQRIANGIVHPAQDDVTGP